jgi:hypothetical protein
VLKEGINGRICVEIGTDSGRKRSVKFNIQIGFRKLSGKYLAMGMLLICKRVIILRKMGTAADKF